MSPKRKKGRGCFCWACGRNRPNEQFSGKGRRRHLCKSCAKLGAERLSALQAMHNLDRATHNGHLIRRGQRSVVERYLTHEDAEVRAWALHLHLHDVRRTLRKRLKREKAALLRTLAAEGLEVIEEWSDWDEEFGFEIADEYGFEYDFDGVCDDDYQGGPYSDEDIPF